MSTSEQLVRAACQMMGFKVVVVVTEDAADARPIVIECGRALIGQDDCITNGYTPWDHYCYRTWDRALWGLSTYRKSES